MLARRHVALLSVVALAALVGATGPGSCQAPYHAMVRWTSYGIPHVQASDWGSLGYGYGFAFAHDNLCVLAEDVVEANAELSRYFGPGGGNLQSDFIWALYNADPADDPGGAGTAPGAAFDVAGLAPQLGDPDGMVGQVVFPEVAGALREDVADERLGAPRDLNLDGAVDAANHAGDYRVLDRVPVRFRCRCTRDRGENALLALGRDDLEAMIVEKDHADVRCEFCADVYRFDGDAVRAALERLGSA